VAAVGGLMSVIQMLMVEQIREMLVLVDNSLEEFIQLLEPVVVLELLLFPIELVRMI
jgi:hypothetical protein